MLLAFAFTLWMHEAELPTYLLKSEAVDDELVHSSLVSSGQRHCNLEGFVKFGVPVSILIFIGLLLAGM